MSEALLHERPKPQDHWWKSLPQASPSEEVRSWKSLPLNTEELQQGAKEEPPKRRAVVTAAHWQDMALSARSDKVLSTYDKNGLDEKRITKVLAAGCTCKKNCLKAFSFPDVYGWCKTFHHADEEQQRIFCFRSTTQMLHGLKRPRPFQGRRQEITWRFANGQYVCLPFAMCLALGESASISLSMGSQISEGQRQGHGEVSAQSKQKWMNSSETFTSLLLSRWQ